MDRKWTKRFLPLMMLACVPFLVGASCKTNSVTNPCDVLVNISPKPATNSYLIANDRNTALGIAQIRGRYARYKCPS